MSKILHVVNTYFSLPFFIGGQFLYFKNRDYKLHVICPPSPNLSDYGKNMGFDYLEVEIARKITPILDIIAFFKICSYIKKHKIDIIVGHTMKGSLLAMFAGWVMGTPRRIYFRHGFLYDVMKGNKRKLLIALDRFSAACSTKIVCVSPSVYNRSIELQLNSKEKQIILGKGTCGGIDATNTFNPEMIEPEMLNKLRSSLNLSDDTFVIGYCGRLVKDKGIIELVEAFEILKSEYKKNIKLLLVGGFEIRDAIPKEIVNRMEMDGDIIITGFIFENIQYYYALMNLFILPSFREGFPTSVLEASSMKLPVLTTKATGCIDSIIEGHTGYFISNTKESITEMTLKLINSEEKIQLGINGRSFVLENFDNNILWPIIEKELYQ